MIEPRRKGAPIGIERPAMQTLDEMRQRHLLSAEQHERIHAWVMRVRSPEAILAMPADLWRALSLASVLMNVDADLAQPPLLGDDPA